MTRYSFLLGAFYASLISSAFAQQSPHVGYVFPAGGQQGRTFEVRVGGQFLDNAEAAYVSGPGVHAKVVNVIKAMNGQQANQLREKLRMLMEKKFPAAAAAAKAAEKSPAGNAAVKPAVKPLAKPAGGYGRPIMLSAEEEQTIVDIRKKLMKFVNRPPNPAFADTAVLQVTVAADAVPSVRELRLQTPLGLSNPLVFEIQSVPEVVNKPIDPDDAPAVPLRQLRPQGIPAAVAQPTVDIRLPTVVNGQVLAGQVDRYRFAAKKGQPMVIVVEAQKLMPYIADAVPGWFQAAIALRDEKGEEVAAAGSFQFHPDPVLHYEAPRDGKYVVEIHDSVFRGREDFVYRMFVGGSYITSIFPLGGKPGASATLVAQGWNWPCESVNIEDPLRASAGIQSYGHREVPLPGTSLSFAYDTLPECAEREPNDSPEQAQAVTLPIIVNGRVDRPGDRDVFRFDGKKGQVVVAEVYARRLGSPVDSVLKLTYASGKQLAFNDDHEDAARGLITHHADSWLKAVLPANGAYYLHLYDAQNQGGPEYGYRLRIGPPQPDFDLRIVPSSITVRAGAAAAVTVVAFRRDGFNGPIALSLKDAPAGFRLNGGTILAGREKVRCTLSAPTDVNQATIALKMEGRATIAGREVRRAAVPADDMMQAFYYHHLVPAQEWLVALSERGFGGAPLVLRDEQRVKLTSGGTTVLHYLGPHGPFIRTVQFTLSEPPGGLTLQKTAFNNEGVDFTLKADVAKLKRGWTGNVIIQASTVRTPQPRPGQPNPPKRRVTLGVLPAATVEVVPK